MIKVINGHGPRSANLLIPNKPLSNHELMDYVSQLKIRNFRGVFMSDQLPSKPHRIECGIVNLDDNSNKKVPGNSGTHWVCYYIRNNQLISEGPAELVYFDSFGIQPTQEIVQYLLRRDSVNCGAAPTDYCRSIEYNIFQLQQPEQVICGHLCLFVLYHLDRGKKFEDIITNLVKD